MNSPVFPSLDDIYCMLYRRACLISGCAVAVLHCSYKKKYDLLLEMTKICESTHCVTADSLTLLRNLKDKRRIIDGSCHLMSQLSRYVTWCPLCFIHVHGLGCYFVSCDVLRCLVMSRDIIRCHLVSFLVSFLSDDETGNEQRKTSLVGNRESERERERERENIRIDRQAKKYWEKDI